MKRMILLVVLSLSAVYLLPQLSGAATHTAISKKWMRSGKSLRQSPRKHFVKKAGLNTKGDIIENDVIFGVVDIPGFALDSGWKLEWVGFESVTFTVVPVSGSDRFSFESNTCTGSYGGDGFCEITFRFDPEEEAQVDAEVMIRVDHYTEGVSTPDSDYYFFSLYGAGSKKPNGCDAVAGGSIIRVTDRALGEAVAIVGTGLSLQYSSRFAPEYIPEAGTFVFTSKYSFAENGWAFSPHKLYDPLRKRLFSSDGTVESRLYTEVDEGIVGVVSSDGEEAYVFTEEGMHLETVMTLTGATKYEFEYDVNDRLIKITDRDGLETTITRNGSGYITAISSPYSQVTSLTSTGSGLIGSIQNPNSETHTFTYKTGTGLLETFTKPGGQVSIFSYDVSGHLMKDLGHGGQFWELALNLGGNLVKSSQMGRETVYEKSRLSSGDIVREETSPTGLVSVMTQKFDDSISTVTPIEEQSVTVVDDERFQGVYRRPATLKYKTASNERMTQVNQSFNFGSGTGYFDYVSRTRTYTTSGRAWTELFTRSTRTTTLTSPEGATKAIQLTVTEKPAQIQIGSDTPISYTYDVFGRLGEVSQGTKNEQTYTYDANGYVSFVTNGRSEVTSYGYDAAGRVTQITLPDLRTIGLQYDANGNRTGIVTPSSVTHAFQFNTLELTSKYEPPTVPGLSPKDTTYNYNLDKQLTQILRPDGKYASYSYDSTKGRLNSIATDAGSYSYSYFSTKPDLIEEISSPQGIKNVFSYRGYEIASDEQVRVSDSASLGKVTFGYDSDHRVISRTVQDSTSAIAVTNYTLNDDDRPTAVGSMDLTYSYPSGRLSTTTLNRISDTRAYDTYGNLETYTATYAPAVGSPVELYSYTLVRDSMSRIVGKTEAVLGSTSTYEYHYDVAGRLTSVEQNSVEVMAFTYDLNGNRTSIKRGAATFNATYDDQDRILTFGPKSYAHNQNGDLTQVSGLPGLPANFSYDVFGNLRQASVPSGKTFAYSHDGRSRRVERKENGMTVARYLYQDQYRIASEMTPAGVLKKLFVYATDQHVPDYMTEAGVSYRIVADHLGSPRLIVNADTGAVVQRMDYDTLGRVTRDSNVCFQPFGFAGGLLDHDTRLMRYGARDYDSEVGRWTSKDPILFDGGDINLYGYVLMDPVNFIDTSGLSTDDFWGRQWDRTKDLGKKLKESDAEKRQACVDFIKETYEDAFNTIKKIFP